MSPFELQDFNLYYMLRFGYRPSKVAFLAWCAWRDRASGVWPELSETERRHDAEAAVWLAELAGVPDEEPHLPSARAPKSHLGATFGRGSEGDATAGLPPMSPLIQGNGSTLGCGMLTMGELKTTE